MISNLFGQSPSSMNDEQLVLQSNSLISQPQVTFIQSADDYHLTSVTSIIMSLLTNLSQELHTIRPIHTIRARRIARLDVRRRR